MPSKLIVALLATALTTPASPQFGTILQGLGIGNKQSETKVASGLKEALRIGTDNAVNRAGTTDGFFKNLIIKILLPEKIRKVEKALRMVGFGSKLDEFELSMNRAAEKAAPAARSIFKDALREMTFTDARKIFTGGDTAATEYFKAKTAHKLKTTFTPIVESAMTDTGVVRQYKQLTTAIQRMTFGRVQSEDITDYVVSRTLDGLFYLLGQEEKKIRTDPLARITPLLKEVFGKR
ncbi:MAG TPA: DUF4197 domain-containing protein [Bryobacteraceae bacterium]|nr:DUF4197 domain-containing protein [Bryobacteraceae bacterium]HPT26179.1 DUF4197 domain-containing protein [Bryobacteraceae bacterium]